MARVLPVVVALAALVAGCGPKVKIPLASNAVAPRHLALLPTDYSIDIPRERVDLVRASLLQEMRNRNFIVAEDTVVSRVCSTPRCPERKRLASEYMVDGFVTLNLDSFSKNSFLAGYYNQLSGIVSISDVNDKELFALEHTQSERGGLLFNSGQVLQGIISQVKNTGDDAYRDLSQKFAQTVVGQLPLPQQGTSAQSPESLDVSLTTAVAQPLSPTSYSVCAQGTPHSIAALLVGSHRTTLREVAPGRYCAAFSSLVAAPESSPAYVELRTAYGNSLRQQVRLPAHPPCKLDGRVKVTAGALRVECAAIGSDRSQQESGCGGDVPRCVADKIVLFKATNTNQDTFQKVGESRTAQLALPTTGTPYELIAVDESGTSSVSTSVVDSGSAASK